MRSRRVGAHQQEGVRPSAGALPGAHCVSWSRQVTAVHEAEESSISTQPSEARTRCARAWLTGDGMKATLPRCVRCVHMIRRDDDVAQHAEPAAGPRREVMVRNRTPTDRKAATSTVPPSRSCTRRAASRVGSCYWVRRQRRQASVCRRSRPLRCQCPRAPRQTAGLSAAAAH